MRLISATFPAGDPERLDRWYAETFGQVPVAFTAGEASPQHVAFHAADLAAWRARLAPPLLTDADGRDEFEFAAWEDARSLYVADPEGNVVELVARPRVRPELALAEVGLPVANVAAALEALERDLGLAQYSGDRSSFAAVGDPDGLLIVVSTGRGWFPSGVPAGTAPVAVEAEGDRAGELPVPGSRHRVSAVAGRPA